MAKSIIVYGPDIDLMQQHAEKIFDHYGIEKRIGFDSPPADGCVALILWTHEKFPKPPGLPDVPVVAFRDFAKAYNAAIPLTDWQSGPPPMVGVYEKDVGKSDAKYWYWNGRYWEVGGWFVAEEAAINIRPQSYVDSPWRGLSAEPIKVTE